MSLSGDLATLELADLLQNLEVHQRTGVLSVVYDGQTTHLCFQEGCLSMMAREERANLMAVLVASGTLTPEQLEAAQKKRRRTRKSLGEVLVRMGALDEETLKNIAVSRLMDEACELVATKRGEFSFHAGPVPRGMFDPEERRLGLRLAAGPLLMESARREDHWCLIRQRLPSDGVHLVAQGKPSKLEGEQAALAEQVVPLLDGSRSIAEIGAAFPHRRFEVYQLLSDLVDQRAARAPGSEEWLALVAAARPLDPERAKRLLQRALSAYPQHIDLLAEQVALAQELDELELAVEALRLVVHLAFEAGDTERGRHELARARDLVPKDPSFLERSVELALDEGRLDEAIAEGRILVARWRKPGLHTKAAALLERLHAQRPEDLELLTELARSRADCGRPEEGIALLLAHGEKRLAAKDDVGAGEAFAAVLAMDPKNPRARERAAALESGAIVRRRARRQERFRRARLTLVGLLLAAGFVHECLARHALNVANSTVARERLIESERYDAAAAHYAKVIDRFPLSLTAQWNARRVLGDLARKGGKAPSED